MLRGYALDAAAVARRRRLAAPLSQSLRSVEVHALGKAEDDHVSFRSWWPGVGRDLWLNGVISSTLMPTPLRWRLLRAYGADVSPRTISPGVWLVSRRLSIGEGSFLNTGC